MDSLFDQVESGHPIDNPSPILKKPLKGGITQALIPEHGDGAVFITVDYEIFSKIQCRAQWESENLRIASFSDFSLKKKTSRKKNGDTFAPVEVSSRINNHILLTTQACCCNQIISRCTRSFSSEEYILNKI